MLSHTGAGRSAIMSTHTPTQTENPTSCFCKRLYFVTGIITERGRETEDMQESEKDEGDMQTFVSLGKKVLKN